MSGQLALVTGGAGRGAAVWETLPPALQREVAVRLAWLVARLVEAQRDELAKVTEEHRGRRAVVYVRQSC